MRDEILQYIVDGMKTADEDSWYNMADIEYDFKKLKKFGYRNLSEEDIDWMVLSGFMVLSSDNRYLTMCYFHVDKIKTYLRRRKITNIIGE